MNRISTHHTSRFGWMTKALTAAAVTATTVLSLTGSAHAYTGTSVAGPAPTNGMYSDGTSNPAPPTPNLQNLNSNLRATAKSVSAAVHLDKGLTTPGAYIRITVTFADNFSYTQTYSNAYGNRFAFTYPALDGNLRYQVINVTMVEHKNGTSYTYKAGRSVAIRPLWDVSIGQLDFGLLNDCANFGDSNINLYFTESGVQGQFSFALGQYQSHYIPEFARSWSEVGVSDDLRVPSVDFYDEDFHFHAWLEGPAALSDQRILPAATGSHLVSWVQSASNWSCKAQISYGLTTTLRMYNV